MRVMILRRWLRQVWRAWRRSARVRGCCMVDLQSAHTLRGMSREVGHGVLLSGFSVRSVRLVFGEEGRLHLFLICGDGFFGGDITVWKEWCGAPHIT